MRPGRRRICPDPVAGDLSARSVRTNFNLRSGQNCRDDFYNDYDVCPDDDSGIDLRSGARIEEPGDLRGHFGLR